jgi:hypothetical protein
MQIRRCHSEGKNWWYWLLAAASLLLLALDHPDTPAKGGLTAVFVAPAQGNAGHHLLPPWLSEGNECLELSLRESVENDDEVPHTSLPNRNWTTAQTSRPATRLSPTLQDNWVAKVPLYLLFKQFKTHLLA